MSLLERVNFRDLDEDPTSTEENEFSGAAAAGMASTKINDQMETLPRDDGGEKKIIQSVSVVMVEERGVELSTENDEKSLPVAGRMTSTTGPLLRRSQSETDATENGQPTGTKEEKLLLATDEVEISLPNDKHRRSLVAGAAGKSSGSPPVLRRRQTVLDSAIHNLLQEGKDFLHRKRQQVPLFGSHFVNKTEVLPPSPALMPSTGATASIDGAAPFAATQHSTDSQSSHHSSSQIGSIVYRRKNDSVTLECKEQPDPPEKEKIIVKVHSLAPMEDGDQLMDSPADLSLVNNGGGTVPPAEKFPPALAKSSPVPARKSQDSFKFGSDSRRSSSLSMKQLQQQQQASAKPYVPGSGNNDQQLQSTAAMEAQPKKPGAPYNNGDYSTTKKKPTVDLAAFAAQAERPGSRWGPVLKYYKQIIGALLFALTVAELVAGIRGVPLFFLGILWGTYLTFLAARIIFWFCLPPDRYPRFGEEIEPPAIDERVEASRVVEEELLSEDTIVYKGWMNRLPGKYTPQTYHVNKLHTVLVRLDRSTLRISTPKTNLPRHAFCREQRMNPAFVSQEMFDMRGAIVTLRPQDLAHRRWCSKKYPITLLFPPKEIDPRPNGRRDSTPVRAPVAMQDLLDVKLANDVSYNADTEDVNEPGPDEVAIDALAEGVRTRRGQEVRDDEETDLETDGEDVETSSLHSTSSLPNIGEMNEQYSRKNRRKHQTKRRVINLFARSSREKENWFYRLRRAACYYSYSDRRDRLRDGQIANVASDGQLFESSEEGNGGEMPLVGVPFLNNLSKDDAFINMSDPLATEWILFISMQKQFAEHMKAYLPTQRPNIEVESMDLNCMMWKTYMGNEADVPDPDPEAGESAMDIPSQLSPMCIDWVNAFGARMFYDFSRNPLCMDLVRDRIQRKLATLHLPYFIETLQLTHLEAGTTAPRIIAVNSPTMNEWGLWIDAKMEYMGGVRLILETKVNLMKLKTDPQDKEKQEKERLYRYADNEFPESPETSPDEDASVTNHVGVHWKDHTVTSKPPDEKTSKPEKSKGKKILHFVEKLADNKYFKEATENKFVKKLMQGVSDTALVLEVEVVHLCGPLVINLPPPPSDRVWYGFRFPPKVILKARPRVGERAVNLSHITDWIENKLVLLLEKFLVVPNLDDLIVPIMGGSPLFQNFNR